MPSVENPRPRAVIIAVQLPDVSDAEHASSLAELGRLADTLGFDVVGEVSQKRTTLAPGAVLGEGKLLELARWTGGTGVIPSGVPAHRQKSKEEEEEVESAVEPLPAEQRAAVVLVDHEIGPSQARNLERATGAEVLDRTAVILAIFQRHARTREASLQVELARLAYVAPRLRETGGGADRQGGGIGAKGAGETRHELDRRRIRDRMAELREELAGIEKGAEHRRSRRSTTPTVAIVGYTNAGKSSLMRAMTGSDLLVADQLFATLDTTVRALHPETRPRILVIDTVGFIKKLPHDLVASFRSTLAEARDASLLLHVVDGSDAAFREQMRVTLDVLGELHALEAPRLLVLNKADKLTPEERDARTAEFPDAILLSAKNPDDVTRLHAHIVDFFEREMVDEELFVPYAQQRVVSAAHEACRVLGESHDENGTRLRVRARPEVVARLRAQLG
jgi:GTP-binding protein HflX